MLEILDNFQDTEIETPKAKERYGQGHRPPLTTIGSLGERCKLLQSSPSDSGVWGFALAENGFGAFRAQQRNTSLMGKNMKMLNCI